MKMIWNESAERFTRNNVEPEITHEKIPPGVYTVDTPMLRPPELVKEKFTADGHIKLNNMITNDIAKEVDKFLSNETIQKYKMTKTLHKRGILMYGVPGTGKTMTLIDIANDFVKRGGVVILNQSPDCIKLFTSMVRINNPNVPILAILEEFETWITHGGESEFLNLLDGVNNIENIVYLATTNYIDKIPDRFKYRPSRFARTIEVGTPSQEDKLLFLREKTKDLSKGLISDEVLIQLAEKSIEFVLDQVKEALLSVIIFDKTVDEALMLANKAGFSIKDQNSIQKKHTRLIAGKTHLELSSDDDEDSDY